MLVIDKNFRGVLSRNIDDYPEGIVVVVDKPFRWTSADVIRKVKFAAIRHFGKRNLKVGHAGTLDPLATGVLLVCIGNACKRAQEFQDHDKEYLAGICFGATTPSYDREKEVDRLYSTEGISRESVAAMLPSFLGEQDQVAPLFSAKMVDGVRSYELARKMYREGAALDEAAAELLNIGHISINEIELVGWGVTEEADRLSGGEDCKAGDDKVPKAVCHASVIGGSVASRSVAGGSIAGGGVAGGGVAGEVSGGSVAGGASSRINVAAVPEGLPYAIIRIACSKGTYIRSIARDAGERMGSGAFLLSLCRSRSGSFHVKDAISIAEIPFLSNSNWTEQPNTRENG